MPNPINSSAQDQEPIKKPIDEGAFEISLDEKKVEHIQEPEKTVEKPENNAGQELQTQRQLREKIENIELADHVKQQASAQANAITSLSEEEKMKSLLKAAKQKGVVYAVALAKKMNDPYILDMLHDALAKEGHYKEFLK